MATARPLPISSQENLAALLAIHWNDVVHTCMAVSHYNPQVADEILSLTLENIFNGFHGFQGNSKFTTWVGSIARNTHLNYQRGLRRRCAKTSISIECPSRDGTINPIYFLQSPTQTTNPNAVLETKMAIAKLALALTKCMGALPEQKFHILWLWANGEKPENIAQQVGVKPETIRSSLSRIKNALQHVMKLGLRPSEIDATLRHMKDEPIEGEFCMETALKIAYRIRDANLSGTSHTNNVIPINRGKSANPAPVLAKVL